MTSHLRIIFLDSILLMVHCNSVYAWQLIHTWCNWRTKCITWYGLQFSLINHLVNQPSRVSRIAFDGYISISTYIVYLMHFFCKHYHVQHLYVCSCWKHKATVWHMWLHIEPTKQAYTYIHMYVVSINRPLHKARSQNIAYCIYLKGRYLRKGNVSWL